VNPHLDFLLSAVYDSAGLHPDHLADLRKSGLTDDTIARHKIRSVPPDMIDGLLGFRAAAVKSAYIIPFPDPAGGWLDHVRLKVFSIDGTDEVRADHVVEHRERWRYNSGARKYLVRRRSAPRLYFPIPTMTRVLDSGEPLWVCEGMKKALAVSQIRLPVIGIESAWSWSMKGTRALIPDFDAVPLADRIVELVPDWDADPQTARHVEWSMRRLADALRTRGAWPRLVRLPAAAGGKVGIDDYLVTVTAGDTT
jgi:hypothetical protein